MNRAPVAYIRRSVARRRDPGDISREFQTEKVRALANGDRADLRIIDADWGISADREATHKRLAFLEMIAAVERGEVSTIYAFACDRLARSVQWSARLLDACEDAGTMIVTGEGRFDPGDDRDRQMFHFYAMQNEGALRAMKKKAQASVGARRNRGDIMGGRPYGEVRTRKEDGVRVGADENPKLVLATFKEAGSYFGAARLLNERKVPSRSGRQWYARTVARIVNREDPSTVPSGTRRGARSISSRPFAGLLRCHCGAVMGQTTSNQAPKYRCPNGVVDPSHPRPYVVSEWRLMGPIEAEASRLLVPESVEMASDDAEREALEAKRDRWIEQYADGLIDKAKRDQYLARIEDDLDRLGSKASLRAVPTIDWSWDPTILNRVLRSLWSSVQLGPDLMPLPYPDGFTWTVPEWRVADTPAEAAEAPLPID